MHTCVGFAASTIWHSTTELFLQPGFIVFNLRNVGNILNYLLNV